ncbi:MAG: delta-60 repeat domain-containing protein, partial [Opitutaceae bacterium]
MNSNGSVDANFELDPGGRILISVTQADGRIVVGGTFTSIGGATHNYLARLNADGSVDPTYNPNFNGRVYALAYEPASNKVIVGGAFTTIGGEFRNHIARLNPSGTIDSEFNPHIDGQVGVIVLQSDGRILVGGTFQSVQPVGAAAPTSRSNILRLNSNGSLDTGFDPSLNSSVSAIAVQPDGKILIGGLFNVVAPGLSSNTSAAVTSRSSLARFNADGTLDTAFSPNPNGQVSTIVVQSDNKIVIGGAFTGMAPPGATELTPRSRIARINADGTIDTAYDPGANDNVLTAALQSDGKLLIGGPFVTLQPGGAESETPVTLRLHVARLNTDGTVDSSFDLGIDDAPGNRVDSLRVLPDGRVFIGGSFNSLHPSGTPTRIARRNFARLAANGTVDTSFEPSAGGSTGAVVNGFAIQPDGKVIAAGDFSDLGGAKSTNIARYLPEGNADAGFSSTLTTDGPVNAVAIRPNGAPVPTQLAGFTWLNANGTLRPAFNATTRLSGEINAVATDAGGRVLLGGSFANLDETTAGNLVRFNANGTLDTSFNPAPNGTVTGIAILPDNRLVIVGAFTTVNGIVRNRIARMDPDGTVDTTFDPNVNNRVNALVVQGDGPIVIGGAFTSLTPNLTETAVTRNFIARINTNGTLDTNYNPSPNFNVNALALHPDGKVIAGGAFTAVQPNSSTEAVTRNGIARFNVDGTVDTNFIPNANGVVNALLALPDEQLLAGGSFTAMQPGATGPVYTRN